MRKRPASDHLPDVGVDQAIGIVAGGRVPPRPGNNTKECTVSVIEPRGLTVVGDESENGAM